MNAVVVSPATREKVYMMASSRAFAAAPGAQIPNQPGSGKGEQADHVVGSDEQSRRLQKGQCDKTRDGAHRHGGWGSSAGKADADQSEPAVVRQEVDAAQCTCRKPRPGRSCGQKVQRSTVSARCGRWAGVAVEVTQTTVDSPTAGALLAGRPLR